jgi:hypothetical protein
LSKQLDPFWVEDAVCHDDSEPVTMGLNLIDLLFSMSDIRGHIPENRRIEAEVLPVAVGKQVLVVTAGLTGLTLFVAPLAVAIWLAIRLL